MRLIDADKLPYVNKVILVDKSDGDIIITIAKECTSYVNDETPTVEAIPIKDIKDFLRCEKINNCDWLNCSECSQSKCISIRNLNDLIEWSKEKENETNR